ncbi:outer membrane protein assembly factor BamB family protein [Actinoplanes palleronii]|uniref:Pyrrolo-quinoline quinone repeat domain-containing protein n=1 Tax=Actinoplanes palleronii TaxID=113570 RepID=A0ABQ4B5B2_9ACTN|nr:PQQ-binding-like beta-propeller repeat protein [Actinoplanes palleronii]GIE65859.1 hypothetical protein Apa02nite_019670 [Actinoplanes palleronii]
MSTDLDELFMALGRQADAVPPVPLAAVKARGRQRNRNRTALAAAAAVLLVTAGLGVALQRERHADPILPATTPSRIRGMAPLGEPLRVATGANWTAARISGTRVIGFAGAAGGGHEVVARDTRTGKTLWTVRDLDVSYLGVATTATAVIFVRQTGEQSEASSAPVARSFEIHDPATGAELWKLPHTDQDRFVLHEDVLVRLVGATGATEAYDLVTGERRWSAPAGGDRPLLITGTQTGADAREVTAGGSDALWDPSSAKAFPFTDDRLVQATTKGRIVIRDIHTGTVRSTTPGPSEAGSLMAYEGMAYTTTGPVIRATGVSSRVVYEPRTPWYSDDFFPCGRDRLCVFESDEQESRLLLIDATTGATLRTTPAPVTGTAAVRLGHIMTSAGGDKGTALYDENGTARYSDAGVGGFIDDGNALTMTRDDDGRFVVRGVSNIDFQPVGLGSTPELSGRCDWNAELLTCPTGTELRTWRFTR